MPYRLAMAPCFFIFFLIHTNLLCIVCFVSYSTLAHMSSANFIFLTLFFTISYEIFRKTSYILAFLHQFDIFNARKKKESML